VLHYWDLRLFPYKISHSSPHFSLLNADHLRFKYEPPSKCSCIQWLVSFTFVFTKRSEHFSGEIGNRTLGSPQMNCRRSGSAEYYMFDSCKGLLFFRDVKMSFNIRDNSVHYRFDFDWLRKLSFF